VVANGQATPITTFAVESPSTVTGANNLLIGIGAGTSLTSGYENVMAGTQSLYYNSTGYDNVAIGFNAMKGVTGINTTGSVCIGTQSGMYSLGNYNTYIGNSAGLSANSSSNTNTLNVGIGYLTLGNITTSRATLNVAVGASALRLLTTGRYNTAIGYQSGYSITGSGDGNTDIGYQAGYTNVSGTNNVCLGYGAGYYETGSSKLFIDNTARTNEADGRIKALIYGEFASTTTAQTLTMNSNAIVREDFSLLKKASSTSDSILVRDKNVVKYRLLAGGWALTGNAGTNPSTNFIGTTDNVSLLFKTNNLFRMALDSNGRVGIGIRLPSEKLDIDGNIKMTGSVTIGSRSGAIGQNSFTMGLALPTYGFYNDPEASGAFAIAIGPSSKSSGPFSISMGAGNTSSGSFSVALGLKNTASSTNSYSLGENNISTNDDALCLGNSNKATGVQSVAIGFLSYASGGNAFAGGSGGVSGNDTTRLKASGNNTFNYSQVWPGFTGVGAAANNSAILGGINNSIQSGATTSAIIGGKINVITASAKNSVILGGNNLTANDSNSVYVQNLYAMGKINISGTLGIGTTVPNNYAFAIKGKTIASDEITVKLYANWQWPDYVFGKDYKLPVLNDVETYLESNSHLPGIPSAADIKENGVPLAEMNSLLLKKIEELTLYIINLNKKVEALEESQKK